MAEAQKMGMNRTGIQMSPIHSREMLEPIQPEQQLGPPSKEDPLAKIGKHYMEHSRPVGSVPLPGSMKGAMKAAKEKITAKQPTTLINKLGERLAFERAGVRLYEGIIRKCMAKQDGSSQPELPIARLQEFRDDEERHFHLLVTALEDLGADPTAQTPDADVTAVAGMGLEKVISEPRTSVLHSLEALLIAELADHAAWHVLIDLAKGSDIDSMVPEFEAAEQQEERHLDQIKAWQQELIAKQP